MPHIYSYVVAHDTGAAPNVDGGICTIAICKPAIRRNAQEGDWIVGDIDGLTVIPKAELEATVTRAQSIATAETACWERILAGASLLDERSQDGTILREASR